MPSITACLGTFNRLPHLKNAVESARRSAKYTPLDFVIADGGSTDGSIEWMKSQPDIAVIEQGKLLGAIAAFQASFKQATGDYVLVINDDTIVDGDTVVRALAHLEKTPGCGAVAFKNNVPGKSTRFQRAPYDQFAGFTYPQCSLVRRWLGNLAGWWLGEPLVVYGGDSALGCRLAELGYTVDRVEGCSVTDYVLEDELREINHQHRVGSDGTHRDSIKFLNIWKDRLPPVSKWQPASPLGREIYAKAQSKTLRTLRLKSVPRNAQPRTGMINAFANYGPTHQINQTELLARVGIDRFQQEIVDAIRKFSPDLLVLQEQGGDSVLPATLSRLRQEFDAMMIVNYNGDCREIVPARCVEIARLCDFSLIVSPDYFQCYAECDVANVAYWPISYEPEFAAVKRSRKPAHGVTFMATNYVGKTGFPDAGLRRDAVTALRDAGIPITLHGAGWESHKLPSRRTDEQHSLNAGVYANSKLGLSISHFNGAFGYSSDRLYLIAATGCPVLLKRFPGCESHGFRDGETAIIFDNIPELIEKTRYYLDSKHIAEREQIGINGRNEVLSNHSWDQRVRDLLDMVRVHGPVGLSGSAEYIAMRGLKGYSMPGCCGKPAVNSNGAAAKSQGSLISLAPRGLNGATGMTPIVYVGAQVNKFSKRGPISGARYTIYRNKPFQVDVRDLRTGKQGDKAGFLEIVEKGVHVFQEFGIAPVITPQEAAIANPPGPVAQPEPTPSLVLESETRTIGIGVTDTQLEIDKSDDIADDISPANATTAAINLADELGVDINTVTGSGKGGKVVVGDVRDHAEKVNT